MLECVLEKECRGRQCTTWPGGLSEVCQASCNDHPSFHTSTSTDFFSVQCTLHMNMIVEMEADKPREWSQPHVSACRVV